VTKNLLSRARPCSERHVKPLVPALFASLAPTYSYWARVVGPFSLWVIHKEGLCPSSGDINRMMMMIMNDVHRIEGKVLFLILFWTPHEAKIHIIMFISIVQVLFSLD
jgi:hypothetical protein